MAQQILQVEDTGGTRRNAGAVTAGGEGAVRTVAPDTDGKLTQVVTQLAGVRSALGDTSGVAKHTLLEYDVGQLVYVGTNPTQGALTSSETWTVKRLGYDAGGQLIDVQELSDVAWDDRASLGWS